MRTVSIVSVLATVFLTTAALADNQPAPTPPEPQQTTTSDNTAQTPPAETADDQKIVCRKEPPPVGSRMGGRKVCHTVAEWRRIEAAARETTQEIQASKVPPQGN